MECSFMYFVYLCVSIIFGNASHACSRTRSVQSTGVGFWDNISSCENIHEVSMRGCKCVNRCDRDIYIYIRIYIT